MVKIAFICIHNSCRSHMAEGWAKHFSKGRFEIYSAGTDSYPQVKPFVVAVMEEVGVDMSTHYPKLLCDIPTSFDVLITMGCGVECPYIPTRYRADWGISDPSGGPIEGFRETRDIIKNKVEALIEAIDNKTLFQDA